MVTKKVEIQDEKGDVYYPHTDASVVFSGGKPLTQVLQEQGGAVVGTVAPSNTKLLWIDTGNSGIIKYHNGTAWVAAVGTYG